MNLDEIFNKYGNGNFIDFNRFKDLFTDLQKGTYDDHTHHHHHHHKRHDDHDHDLKVSNFNNYNASNNF